MKDGKHILSILVENEPGVLSRITGLFSGRGYNIDSIAAAPKPDSNNVTRITMTTVVTESALEQITKQLNKIINVIKVQDLTEEKYVQRELALIKVKAMPENRAEILRIVDIFRCRVVDIGTEHYTIEVTAREDKLDALINLLKPIGIKEVARTGSIALLRDLQ